MWFFNFFLSGNNYSAIASRTLPQAELRRLQLMRRGSGLQLKRLSSWANRDPVTQLVNGTLFSECSNTPRILQYRIVKSTDNRGERELLMREIILILSIDRYQSIANRRWKVKTTNYKNEVTNRSKSWIPWDAQIPRDPHQPRAQCYQLLQSLHFKLLRGFHKLLN